MKDVSCNFKIVLFLFAFIFVNAISVFAGPSRTTYQAKIVKPDGYPLEASTVNFKFTILDPAGSCILYSETYSSVNMAGTGGLISFALGSGVKTYPTSATTTFEEVFSNITPSLTCDAGGPANYSPAASDARKIVMQFHDGNGWQTLPAMSINAVPYAMYANSAQNLNGKTDADFVQVAALATCGVGEALHYNGVGFSCVTLPVPEAVSGAAVVSALGYTPANSATVNALSSSLSSTDNNVASVSSTVASVSSTVFSVSSTVSSLSTSVSNLTSTVSGISNTVSGLSASMAAVVSSQWVTSGTAISYSLGNVNVSGAIRIGMDSTSCAASLAGTLRYNSGSVEYCNGTSWLPFGVAGAGITNINGSTSGSQTFATGITGTVFNISSVNGVHTFNIPLAASSSVTAGLLSNTDYLTFTNKLNATSAAVISALGYTPLDSSVSGTYAVKANNLSDLASATVARANLGLGSLATLNYLDLSSAQASGTLSVARLPAFSGDASSVAGSSVLTLASVGAGVTSGTQYTKVTVDGKGRVVSGAQLSSSDVVTALGYTPGAAASGVTSLNGSTSQTQTFANGSSGNAPAFNTAAGVHTLNIPLASATGSVTAGLISNADYVNFSNKITSSAASIAQVLGYVPASATALGNYAVRSNNLSDLASATVARTNLGLGSLATLNFVDLGTSYASGTLAAARLPAFSGDATSPLGSAVLTLASVGAGVTSGTQYTKVTVDGKGRVVSGAQLSSSDVVTALGYTPGAAASGVTSLNGSTLQTQTFANGTSGNAPAFNTAAGVHTLNIPLASATGSVSAGLISNADYVNFSNKITSSAASIAQVLGYVPASATALGNYAVRSNNLSDLASATVARTNLGLGSLATLNFVDLGTSYASGTLAAARLPAFTGDVVSVAGSATLTVDGIQGRSVLATAPTSGQVLSYNGSAWAPAAVTSSQWTTSGTTINYMAGNVGIGSTNPTARLEVTGDINTIIRATGTNFGSLVASASGVLTVAQADGVNGQGLFGTQSSHPMSLITNNVKRLTIDTSGNVGISTLTPNAKLHLAAGTTSTAPLKLTSGTLLSSPTSGAIEYDGSQLYFTDGSNTRRALATNSAAGSFDNTNTISNTSGNITLAPNNTTGSVIVSATTASTNSQTGALVVKGGLGVAGNIYASGTIITSSNIQGASITATNGMISPYIAGSVAATGSLTLDSTTHATKGKILLAPNGGNVGIGIANPDEQLHLSKVLKFTNTIGVNQFRAPTADSFRIFSHDDAGTGNQYGTSDNNAKIFENVDGNNPTPDDGFFFVNHGTSGPVTALSILGNGYVGIGNSTPTAALEVGKNTVSSSSVRFVPSTSQQGALRFATDNTANWIQSGVDYTTDSKKDIKFSSINGASTWMTLQASSGNVGIGTATPTQKLDVNGGVRSIYGEPTASNTNASGFSFDGDTGMFAAADGRLNFWSNNTRTMSIYQANVGIGTSAPTQALDVSGTVKATAFIGDGSGLTNLSPADMTFYNYASGYAGGAVSFSTLSQGLSGWQDYGGTAMNVGTAHWAGLTTKNSNTGAQFAVNWNTGAGSPSGFKVRAKDDTETEWTTWRDVAFVDATVKKSGDTMTGPLILPSNGLAVGTDQLVVSGTNVGIGTVNPDSAFNVVGTGGGDDDVHIDSYGNTAEGTVMLRRARGTVAAPTTLLANDRMGFIAFRGHNGTSFLDLSRIQASAEADLSVSASTNLQFYTTNDGSMTEKMRITASGTVGVGTATPNAAYRLDVHGDMYVGNGGAAQKIQFKTANTDGAFIRFNSTADAAGSSSLEIGTIDNSDEPIIFTQTANERMRIHTNGYVGIGTAAPQSLLHVNGSAYINSIIGGQLNGSGNFHIDAWNTGADRSVYLNWSSGTGGAKIGNGSAAYGPIAASAFNVSSDRRLKENIKPIENPLEKILKIDAVTFTWKDSTRNKMEGQRIGLIAQNVEQIFPQAVKRDHGENTLPGGTRLVNYPDLVSPIIAAIKEFYALWLGDSKELHKKLEEQKREMASIKEEKAQQSQEIEMLKNKSNQLEEQNKALKDYLCEKDPSAKICQ
ncbi:tail fiber domain-containing protein [Pseudobdellovibrio sp. HCB154]|uniref:tail fiber domain-containing protein n=1 Tax=Pseudobdellovibrio sp. HCB154 TaxID=3386277 RepID=UPI003917322C